MSLRRDEQPKSAQRAGEKIFAVQSPAERGPSAAEEALERATEQLEQQRNWFAVTLSSIGEAVITADTDGLVTFMNPAAEAMTQWPSDAATGQPLNEVVTIVDDDTRKPTDWTMAAVLAAKPAAGFPRRPALVARNGEVHPISFSAAPILDRGGAPAGAVVVLHDVAAHRQAERRLRASEERLRATVNQAAVGIAVADLDGRFLEANQKFCDIVGFPLDELRKQTFVGITHPDDVATTAAEARSLVAGRTAHYVLEKRYVRKDGGVVFCRTTVTLLHETTGAADQFIGITEDITERKLADAARRETDRRKDEFLATLAHELRNPLAPIRQAAYILSSETVSDEQRRWSHDVIGRQVRHMALLLDDLLDISRITRGMLELKRTMTDLRTVFDAAIETALPLIDERHQRFEIDLPTTPVRFAADPLRLAQVLSNLLTNAAKYTNPGGRIELAGSCDDDTVSIAVSDTGIGIPPHALPRLFEMFSQVKSSQDRSDGGLGIGLALSKGLVELHGGRIEATSDGIGRGSRFVVHLPLRQIDAPDELHTSTERKREAHRRVLIADDNRDAAESLAMLVRMDGHDVSVVHDGKEALAALAAGRAEIALLDIGMPEMDGYEVARRARHAPFGRDLTLVAVTGWGQSADKARARASGFDYHFTKPVEPSRLLELLRSYDLT